MLDDFGHGTAVMGAVSAAGNNGRQPTTTGGNRHYPALLIGGFHRGSTQVQALLVLGQSQAVAHIVGRCKVSAGSIQFVPPLL